MKKKVKICKRLIALPLKIETFPLTVACIKFFYRQFTFKILMKISSAASQFYNMLKLLVELASWKIGMRSQCFSHADFITILLGIGMSNKENRENQ